jgi:molecular chaperone DnaK
MQVLGIDLGTTNSAAAIANHVFELSEEGGTILPSVVAFLPNGYTLVGNSARRRRIIDAENTIYSSKRIIGRGWSDSRTQSFVERYPFKMVEGPAGVPLFETRSGRFSATQVASMVLSKVLESVRSLPGEFDVSIAVPAAFTSAQRVATADAAQLAGLRNVTLMVEPIATAHAYLTLPRSFEKVLVYDLGGGTFDCAVIDCRGDEPHMLARASDLMLGGDDIDQKLAEWVARHVLEKHNWDVTNYAEIYSRLLARCEQAKIELSTAEEAIIPLAQVDPECPAPDDVVIVTRRLLEKLCSDLVRRTFITVDSVLRQSNMQPPDIDSVFLAGGTTILPFIQDGVEAYFGQAGLSEFAPTEVVARGACLAPSTSR